MILKLAKLRRLSTKCQERDVHVRGQRMAKADREGLKWCYGGDTGLRVKNDD